MISKRKRTIVKSVAAVLLVAGLGGEMNVVGSVYGLQCVGGSSGNCKPIICGWGSGCTLTYNPYYGCLVPGLYCRTPASGLVTGSTAPGSCLPIICSCVSSGPSTPALMTPNCF